MAEAQDVVLYTSAVGARRLGIKSTIHATLAWRCKVVNKHAPQGFQVALLLRRRHAHALTSHQRARVPRGTRHVSHSPESVSPCCSIRAPGNTLPRWLLCGLPPQAKGGRLSPCYKAQKRKQGTVVAPALQLLLIAVVQLLDDNLSQVRVTL